jgi:hypothetical protein
MLELVTEAVMNRWLGLVTATIAAATTLVVAAQAPQDIPVGQQVLFADQIKAFKDQDRTSPPPQQTIRFIGSSIFREWTTLKEDLAPLPVFNRAFGGARTWELLHYMDQIVLPYRPRIIVYYAGSNDVNAGEPAAAIVARTKAFISRVHIALPDTVIDYASIIKSPDKRHRWDVVDAVNTAMYAFVTTSLAAGAKNLAYSELNGKLFRNGEPRLDLYRERMAFTSIGRPMICSRTASSRF